MTHTRTAIVVLGGKVRYGGAPSTPSHLVGALGRRVEAAAALYRDRARGGRGEDVTVFVTGGRAWGGVVEADAMAIALEQAGVPPERIVRERCALSTRENASYTAAVLERHGFDRAWIVTCRWHMPRALALFRVQGVIAEPLCVDGPPAPVWRRLLRWARELVAARLDGVDVRGGER